MSSSMEVTSSSSSREIRKIRKPLMERKRRARINDSLDALQRLLTEAEGKDFLQNRQTKLEKADILEMTVRHLQNLNRQQKSAQCCCLTTKHSNNSDNNYCMTTSATRGSRINNFSKKSTDRCATTPDTNELISNLGNHSGCSPRDDLECANFPGRKSLENSQFPNKCCSRDEDFKFFNRCSISDRENPRFFQSSPTSDKENSTISGKYVGNISQVSEDSQISKEYLEEFRDFSGVNSDDSNFENIDPSSRGLALKHVCTTHSKPTKNVFKYCDFSLKNCTFQSKNSLKNVGYTSSSENSIENQSSELESSSYLLMKNRNSVENNQIHLGNPRGRNGVLMGHFLENREPVETSQNCRGSSWQNSVSEEMENSDSSPRSDSLSLIPVKLDNGSFAFVVPRSMERHFFEQNSFDKLDSRVLNSNDLSLYTGQNKHSYDELDNRVLNSNNLSLYNDSRHSNNDVTQNVWRPWF